MVKQTFPTLGAAEAALNEWTARTKMGLEPAVWKSLRHYISDFLEELERGAGRSLSGEPLKPGSVKDYLFIFRRLLSRTDLPGFEKPLDSFTHMDAQRLVDVIGEGLSKQTQRKYLALLRVVWKRAQKETGMSRDPFDSVVCTTFTGSGRQKVDALPMRDAYLLAHEISDPAIRIVLLFGIFTGMRINEVFAIRWRHINLEADQPYLTVESNISGGQMSTPKTKAGTRQIGVPPTFRDHLQDWRLWLINNRGEHFVEPDALVCSQRSDPLSPQRSDGFYDKLDRRLGPDKAQYLRLHVLRAGYSTELLRANASIHVASKVLGHASIQTTERHYLQLQAKDLAVGGSFIEDRLGLDEFVADHDQAEAEAWGFYAEVLAEENAEGEADVEIEIRNLFSRHETYGEPIPDPLPTHVPKQVPDFTNHRATK